MTRRPLRPCLRGCGASARWRVFAARVASLARSRPCVWPPLLSRPGPLRSVGMAAEGGLGLGRPATDPRRMPRATSAPAPRVAPPCPPLLPAACPAPLPAPAASLWCPWWSAASVVLLLHGRRRPLLRRGLYPADSFLCLFPLSFRRPSATMSCFLRLPAARGPCYLPLPCA